MPETDVIFRFEAQDDLSPVLDKIKAELDAVSKTSGGAGIAESFQKSAASQREFAQETKEAGFAMEQWKELTAGVGYNLGLWNLGFIISQKIMDLVSDSFKNATTMAQYFTEQMNISRSSTGEQVEALDSLKKAAEESGMSLGDDFTKFVMPSVRSLEELGLTEKEAGEETKVLGQYMRAFGVDMRDLSTKVELGTASFSDLLKAGNALGPMFQQEALAWQKFEIAEAQANLELQRSRQLMNEAYEDSQRLASAHEGFAQSTGLASSAFQAFRNVQTLTGGAPRMAMAVQIPTELANLPGSYQAYGKLLGEIQQKFRTGISQIAKEEGLSERLVTAGVTAGMPGFDEKALLAAAQRSREASEIARHRKDETEDFTRRDAAEKERIKLNNELKGALKEQGDSVAFAADRAQAFDNYTKSIKGQTDKIAEGWASIGIKVGDALNAIQKQHGVVGGPLQMLNEMIGAFPSPVAAAAAGIGRALVTQQANVATGQDRTPDLIKAVADGFKGLMQMFQAH